LGVEPGELEITLPAKKSEPRAGKISLTNRAERSLLVKFEASPRIKPIGEVTLAPRATEDVAIEVAVDRTVPVHEQIRIVGAGFHVPVTVNASAEEISGVEKTSRPPSARVPSPPPSATPRRLAVVAPAVTPPSAPLANPYLAVHARRVEGSQWELRWPQPQEPVGRYQLDERILSREGGSDLQISWRPLTKAEFTTSDATAFARLRSLDPKQLHMLRLIALRPDGSTIWEAPLVALAPVNEAPHHDRGWLLIGAIVLAGLLYFRWRARRISP
jgi:hypothetical protein